MIAVSQSTLAVQLSLPPGVNSRMEQNTATPPALINYILSEASYKLLKICHEYTCLRRQKMI